MKRLKTIQRLNPFSVTKVWGGERLAEIKSSEVKQSGKIGETWEVSIHPDGPSSVFGCPLSNFLTNDQLPYLVKLIDTSDNLSVQVHPDDDYAKTHENSSGKTECWLILDSGPECGIYLGMKNGIKRDSFMQALENNEDMSKFLEFYETKKGDFFYVPAGTIHAIGKDVLLCEVQQSSGITYRVWDWNRNGDDGKPRELHVSKAMDVLRFEDNFNSKENFKIKNNIFDKVSKSIIQHNEFQVHYYYLNGKEEIKAFNNGRMNSFICLEGSFEIYDGEETYVFTAWNTALIMPEKNYSIKGRKAKILWIG